MTKYKITCKQCKSEREIALMKLGTQEHINWLENDPDPLKARIISARKRLDGKWGFQCICGQDDLLTLQEQKQIADKQSPKPKEIDEIIKDLKPDNRKMFEMKEL